MSSWTQERVALLKKLWPTELTAKQIAARLGGGFTKNAVISKGRTLKLPSRSEISRTPAHGVDFEFQTRLGQRIPPPLAVHVNRDFKSVEERLEEVELDKTARLILGTWKPKGMERPIRHLPLFKQREIRAEASQLQAFMRA